MKYLKDSVSASVKDKTYVQTMENVKISYSLAVGEKTCKTLAVADRKLALKEGMTAVRYYRVSDRDFVYCADGYLYEINSEGTCKVTLEKYDTAPEIFIANGMGEKLVAVAHKHNLTVIGREIIHTRILCADGYTCYRGRAFAVKDRKLYFGSPVCGKLSEADVTINNFIICPEKFGKLIQLVVLDSGLYLFAEHGVLKVSSGADVLDVSLSEVCAFEFTLVEGTVLGISDKAYFTDGECLYVFVNSEVKVHKSMLDGLSFAVNGRACMVEKGYALPIYVFGEECLYYFNPHLKAECFIPVGGLFVSNGFTLDPSTGAFGDIRADDGEWQLTLSETDFGTDEIKTLHCVNVCVDCDVTIFVKGDELTKSYAVKKGNSKFYPNMHSDKFSIAVRGFGRGLTALKLAYGFKI